MRPRASNGICHHLAGARAAFGPFPFARLPQPLLLSPTRLEPSRRSYLISLQEWGVHPSPAAKIVDPLLRWVRSFPPTLPRLNFLVRPPPRESDCRRPSPLPHRHRSLDDDESSTPAPSPPSPTVDSWVSALTDRYAIILCS